MTWDDVQTIAPWLAGLVIAWWGHRRGQKTDAATVDAGVLTQAQAGTSWFVEQLQEDNAQLRAERDAAVKEAAEANRELNRMRRKYGNGDNGP